MIITPNQRLARQVLRDHARVQSQDKITWETPRVLAYNTWLEHCWREQDSEKILLNAQQFQHLWQEVVGEQTNLEASNTAQLAMQTWGLLKQWSLDLTDPQLQQSSASRYWLAWALKIQDRCQKNNWIDTDSVSDALEQDVRFLKPFENKKIVFYNFLEHTPQQENLIAALKQYGATVEFFTHESRHETSQVIECETPEEEIQTIACWAKQLADSGEKNIACIFPRLNQQRDKILSIFEEVFFELPTLHQTLFRSPYNISAGLRLNTHPLIQETLLLLELTQKSFSLDTANAIIKSPFMGKAESELSARALLYETLCDSRKLTWNLESLLAVTTTTPELHQGLLSFKKTVLELQNKKIPPSSWGEPILNLLASLGWPGEQSLSSAEFQVANRFRELLHDLASFDLFDSTISLAKAIHHVKQLVKNTVFQYQTQEHPIEILGVLEASGLQFDHAWIADMTESVWPPIAKPNPFLPKKCQRELNMPHSSANRELEFCTQVMDQLTRDSKNSIFSFAKKQEGQEQQKSFLLQGVANKINLLPFTSLTEKLFATRTLESVHDEQGLLLNTQASGGSSILKDQASCPFKAYAHHRFSARRVEAPEPGLSAAERGSIIHDILDQIWESLKSQEALLAMSSEKLNSLIETAIQKTLSPLLDSKSRFFALEKTRLKNIMLQWLALEKKREPFKVIGRELPLTTNLSGLTINMRADRVDQLQDGRTLIIDYKTNRPNIQSWFGERPDEPQLPLYGISSETPPNGLLFGQIHPLNVIYKGITDTVTNIPDVTALTDLKSSSEISWEQQLEIWRANLEMLAKEYVQGHAAVTPKSTQTSCAFCDLHSLCRIHEVLEAEHE